MQTVKDCEALYPIGMGWQDNVHLALPSDDENMSNLSGRSGYSSAGEFNSLRYMSDLRNTLGQMEEGKSSTADDTEATSQAQTSVMQGDTSSAASNLSKSPAILAQFNSLKGASAAKRA